MRILHLTSDLMMSSQVSQAARPRGIVAEQVIQLDRLFARIDASTALIILDLQSPNWSADQFQKLREIHPISIPCVAYAQHVFPELLEQAKQAKIDTVLTRGQFSNTIPELFNRLNSIDA